MGLPMMSTETLTHFPFDAFITNLGKYNEGELVGEWVHFPTSSEELQAVFKRIGIGDMDDFGHSYEKWFITDYDCYVPGLYDILGEYENLDELNYLASKIEEMSNDDFEIFEAAVEMGEYTDSIKDLINLTDNLDCYNFYSDIHNDSDLGYYWVEESGAYDTRVNNILIGKTHQIKNLFEEVGLTKKDTPFKEFSEYEKKYPKKVFMVYQLKENSDKYGLVYSAPIQKDTTLDKIYEDFSKKISFDFVGHTIGISDIVLFSDENGQRSFYLGEDGWKKIDIFIHEREDAKMDDKLKVLVVEPMCEPYVKEFDSGLESLQKEVGGLIQVTYPYEDLVGIVCNDEGKTNGMQLNRAIYDDNRNMTDIIAGTFLVVGLSDDSFTSLTDEQIKKFSDKFKMPEQFYKLGNEIVALPVKPSIKQQINQAKKEQDERNGTKPPSHKLPEI